MTTVRANRTRPLTLTDDSLNVGVSFAVDFAGDDGIPFVGGVAPTKVGTLPVVNTSVGTNSGRDISNGGAGGANQYKWLDAQKIGVPSGVAAFTLWARMRTPSAANSSPVIREFARLTNGTTTKLTLNQYELNNTFAGYGINIQRDNGTNTMFTYSDTSAIIAPDTVYDVHISRDAAGAFKVYVNGVLRKTGSGFVSDFTIVAGSNFSYFGASGNTKGGVLIDAMVWNRQLSDSEVTTQQSDPYSYQLNPDTPTVTLTTPAPGTSVSQNIVITGTSNTVGGIEARFNGGAWQTIVAAHTGSGTYSGTLPGQTPGTGLLEVRLVGRSATASSANITVVAASISITSPVALQAIQQAAGVATIPVVVSYVSPTANIEARFNGGAWQSFAVTSSPQTINLVGCPIGEGPLDVRMKESTGIAASVNNIAVCNPFLIIGQSNQSGRGNANNSYATSGSHPGMTGRMFANATTTAIGVWANLADPVDAGGTGEAAATNDTTQAAGSQWPLLGTALIAAGMPAAFIPAAKGGVGVGNYAKTNGLDTTTAYGYAVTRALAVGAKYALYYQGESDAISGTSNYEAQLNTLVNNLWNDAGIITIIGKTHYWTGQSTASIDAIRTAQQNVIDSNPHAVAGPDLLGANTGGDIHFLLQSELQEVANRWYTALNAVHLVQGDLIESGPVGTLSATLAAMTLAGTATAKVSGLLGATLGPVILAAAGTSAAAPAGINGQASITFAPMVLAGAGTVDAGSTSGQLSVTLQPISLSASGQLDLTGFVSTTLQDMTLAATGGAFVFSPSLARRIAVKPSQPSDKPEPMPVFRQAAGSNLDYSVDWSPWLAEADDAIVSYDVSIPAQLASDGVMINGNVTTGWAGGGIANYRHVLRFRIVTASGRIISQSIVVAIDP